MHASSEGILLFMNGCPKRRPRACVFDFARVVTARTSLILELCCVAPQETTGNAAENRRRALWFCNGSLYLVRRS